mgnify:CR=1 FL=1
MIQATTLLVGTTKGLFRLTSSDRATWTLAGPFCGGWPINHAVGTGETLWGAGGNEWYGAGVWRSEDGGETWALTKLSDGEMDDWARRDPEVAAMFGGPPGDPAPFSGEVGAVWSLNLAHSVLRVGTKPAELFESRDGGRSFAKNESFAGFPGRDDWSPGAVGLTLHTIVPHPTDPDRLWLGVSAAGVFASEDGGASWERRNRRSNVGSGGAHTHADGSHHEVDGAEVGLCVHNMVRASGESDRLYQQNHEGVWRSLDGGRSWDEISEGLPSRFGFPIAAHPRDPRTLWTLPLNGDTAGRYPPEASAAVWKSTDGGDTWAKKPAGLPARDCFCAVLLQAMSTDAAEPAGVYFGTNSGSVFASADEGESWREIARHLPTVLCVEVVG